MSQSRGMLSRWEQLTRLHVSDLSILSSRTPLVEGRGREPAGSSELVAAAPSAMPRSAGARLAPRAARRGAHGLPAAQSHGLRPLRAHGPLQDAHGRARGSAPCHGAHLDCAGGAAVSCSRRPCRRPGRIAPD